MWVSLTQLVENRSYLKELLSELSSFAKENKQKFTIIGKEFGDDVDGLIGQENDLFINSWHLNDFLKSFNFHLYKKL